MRKNQEVEHLQLTKAYLGLLETRIIGRKGRGSHARVVAELGSAIVSGRIGEGMLLPNDAELSLRFGVLRTVLRETMKTLAAKRG